MEGREGVVRLIDELHCFGGLVEEYIGSTLSFRREFACPLITSCLGTGQDPEHSLDDEIRDEPS